MADVPGDQAADAFVVERLDGDKFGEPVAAHLIDGFHPGAADAKAGIAGGHQDQRSRPLRRAGQVQEHREGRPVGPVQVFQHEQQRAGSAHRRHQSRYRRQQVEPVKLPAL